MIELKSKINPELSLKLNEVLLRHLAKGRERCLKHDFDFFAVMGGDEGSGKSSLACQIGSFWMRERFNVKKNMHWRISDIISAALSDDVQQGDLFILDESYRSAAAIHRGKRENEDLRAFFKEVRKKNLAFILLNPLIYELDDYYIYQRARFWIDCKVINDVHRGIAVLYDKKDIHYINVNNFENYKVYPKNKGFVFRFDHSYGFVKKEDYINANMEYFNKIRAEKQAEEDAKKIKLSPKEDKPFRWTEEDMEKLVELKNQGMTHFQIANEIGRTKTSVDFKISRLKNEGRIKPLIQEGMTNAE